MSRRTNTQLQAAAMAAGEQAGIRVAAYKTQRELDQALANGAALLRAQGWQFLKRVKLRRNEVCVCNSGKKAKDCHLGKVVLVAPVEQSR